MGQVGAQSQISSSNSVLVSSALVSLQDGLTVVRQRGMLTAWIVSATGAGDGFSGAFGIGVATADAIAAGAASVPTPITEQDWDGWMYWHAISVKSAGVIDGTAANDGDSINAIVAAQRLEIDIKAMRKLDENQALYGALEVTEVGTSILHWQMDSRVLFKLA